MAVDAFENLRNLPYWELFGKYTNPVKSLLYLRTFHQTLNTVQYLPTIRDVRLNIHHGKHHRWTFAEFMRALRAAGVV